MIAAGKLRAFNQARRDLANRWVSGSVWRQHLEIDKPWDYKGIRASIARRDVHPPLYYWLLHTAAVISGELTPRTGGQTNTLLHVLGILALFALAKRITGSSGWALVAAAAWTFGATAIATTYVARQYELLGLLGITSAWLIVSLFQAERRQWLWATLLALTLAAGLLTHVHAFLLLGAVLVAAVLALAGQFATRRLAVPRAFRPVGPLFALAACPLAGALLLLAHPTAIQQMLKLPNASRF